MTTEEQQTADTASQEEKSEQQTTAAEDSRATPPAETASKEADLAEQASTPPPSGSAASCNASIDELAEAGLLKNDSGNTVQPPSESAAVGALTAPTQDTTSLASAESSPTPAESSSESATAPQCVSTTLSDSTDTPTLLPPGDISSGAQARVKKRLTAHAEDHLAGTGDSGSPRPETPSESPVKIPQADELDATLEAEISAAMETDTSAPVETAPVAGSEGSDEAEASAQATIGPGSKLNGTVQQIHGDDVFVEAGMRSSVVVGLKQFAEDKQPSVGDPLTVIVDSVDDDGLIRARIPHARHRAGGNWDSLSVGQVVDCMVTGTNKGGLQVSVSNLRGFMPASQVDTSYVADLEAFVGEKLIAQVTEVNTKKRNLIVSRRVLLQAERDSQKDGFWKSLEVGQDHEGTVKTIKDYGAFVSLGPIDGFLHIGEISWSRINHPEEVLKKGQTVQVRILKLDEDRKRVSLGMKQLIQNPWLSAAERYAPESIVNGRVTRIADFGAFVQLEPGIEGLAHISELAWHRVGNVSEVLSQGDLREFKVIEVDTKRKRVSLSLKALEERREAPAREEEEKLRNPRRRLGPDLRGGTGDDQAGGGLFGNPSDFT